MKNKSILTVVTATIASILLINPMHIWMPTMAFELLLAILIASLSLYVFFYLRHETEDERTIANEHHSGKLSSVVGMSILIVGILVETLTTMQTMWLLTALLGMIITKIVADAYYDKHY